MKKIYFLLFIFLFPFVAFANGVDITEPDQIVTLFEGIRNWLYSIFLVAVVICFLVAAFYFITAGSNPERLKTAKDFVKYGLIGAIVALLAGGVAALVTSFLELAI